jgi:two-component system, cell cycle response regulator
VKKYLFFILLLVPSITEFLESGSLPHSGRDVITDVVMTVITAILVIAFIRHNQLIERISLQDPLTGIGNRRLFDLNLEKEVLRSKRINNRIGLIFFDLDGFKDINDKYGHKEGDNILIAFSNHLSHFSRTGTDSCYRFGGDEFAVLLTNINDDEMADIANKIEERLENTVYSNLPNGISASKGFVVLNKEETHEQFLKRADDAMYQAKRARYSN